MTRIPFLPYLTTGYAIVESRTAVYRALPAAEQCQAAIELVRQLVEFGNEYAIAKNLNIPGVQPLSLELFDNSCIIR